MSQHEQEIQIVFNFPPFLLRENGDATNKPMRCLAAAKRVLQEGAMHINALTQQMLTRGLWSSHGKTPQQTVRSAIYRYIKANGEASCFKQVAPNTFALND